MTDAPTCGYRETCQACQSDERGMRFYVWTHSPGGTKQRFSTPCTDVFHDSPARICIEPVDASGRHLGVHTMVEEAE